MFEYIRKSIEQIDLISATQEQELMTAAEWIAGSVLNKTIIHAFGTGHSQMIAMEMFARACGLANVNAILDDLVMSVSGARRAASIERLSGLADVLWDKYDIRTEDIIVIISNSGRNALPIEMAMRARKEGVKIIAITSLEQSQQFPSRHPSGKRLFEIADLVIDNCVPSGDGLMTLQNKLVGPASSMAGILIVNTIATEAMKIVDAKGVPLPVYQSQNIDGGDNSSLHLAYKDRVVHL